MSDASSDPTGDNDNDDRPAAEGDELEELDADEIVEGAEELFKAPYKGEPMSDTKTPPPG